MYSKSEEAKTKPITSVKWSADNIVTFLETYVNHELLWNVRHFDYANKAKREMSMIKLKGELIGLGIAVPDLSFLRARIKAIKATYRGELLKVTESKSSGAGTDDVYVPKLSWFPVAHSFLRDVVITRKSTSNLVTSATNGKDDVMDEEIGESENQTLASEENVEKSIAEDTLQPSNMSNFQAPNSKKRRISKLSKVEGAIEKLQKITESRPSTLNNVQPDEADVFGKYVTVQLRDLPRKSRLICQDKIQSMLTKERLKLLESPRPSPSPMLSGTSSYAGDSDDDATIQNEFIADGGFVYRNLN